MILLGDLKMEINLFELDIIIEWAEEVKMEYTFTSEENALFDKLMFQKNFINKKIEEFLEAFPECKIYEINITTTDEGCIAEYIGMNMISILSKC